MAAGLAPCLEQQLRERRERYNAAFAVARRARPGLDGELFLHYLRTLVSPILAELPAQQGAPLVEPLYDLCLELAAADLFRRSPAVQQLWRDLLPRCGAQLCRQPRWLPAALSNAVYNIEREETARVQAWLDLMQRCLPLTDGPEQWLQAGQVASWVCGMAHYRETALPLLGSLPAALRAEISPDWEKAIQDPWHAHRASDLGVRQVRRVGAFAGFGGLFRQPPWVDYAGEGRFLVEDGHSSWVLCADSYGATFKPGVAEIQEPARRDVSAGSDGTIRWAGQSTRLEDLAPVRSFAVSPHALAVTSELSHQVCLILGPIG